MRYMRLTEGQKGQHPSIHYTGSVRGMKKLGYWGKNDICVRCGAAQRQQVAHIDRDRTAYAQNVETHDRNHRVDPREHIRLPPEQQPDQRHQHDVERGDKA